MSAAEKTVLDSVKAGPMGKVGGKEMLSQILFCACGTLFVSLSTVSLRFTKKITWNCSICCILQENAHLLMDLYKDHTKTEQNCPAVCSQRANIIESSRA